MNFANRIGLTCHKLDPVSPNVHCFTKRRAPTVRAAKAFPPPFTEADYLARGGKRPAGPRRVKMVLCAA
jgi:hypothetical protein